MSERDSSSAQFLTRDASPWLRDFVVDALGLTCIVITGISGLYIGWGLS